MCSHRDFFYLPFFEQSGAFDPSRCRLGTARVFLTFGIGVKIADISSIVCKGSSVPKLSFDVPGFPSVETFDYVVEENGKAFRLVGTTPSIVILGGGDRKHK